MNQLLVALGLAFAGLLLTSTPSQAKEFEIDGSIDCGKLSQQPCLPITPTVGVITDQVTGRRERVDVVIGLLLQQKLGKSRLGQSLLNDPLGVNRVTLFNQMKPTLELLAQFDAALRDPNTLSNDEKERVVNQLFDRSLSPDIVTVRDMLILISQNFAQDARVRVTVTDELGPVLVATGIVQYHDYQMSQTRSSGTVNLSQLTGDDSESFLCTDFVEEALDFAKQRVQEEGKLQLTDRRSGSWWACSERTRWWMAH